MSPNAILFPQRALLVCRTPVLSESVATLLSEIMYAPSLVSVTSAAEALTYLEANLFDAIVCDASDCVEDLERLVTAARAARKVFLDMAHDARMSQLLRSMGADAYLPWRLPIDELRAILRQALSGHAWFGEPCSGCPQAVTADSARQRLSRRQRDVHRLIERGCSNKDIADALEMSPATVKIHVNAILKALGARNRTEAAIYFRCGFRVCGACRLIDAAKPARPS